MIFRVAIILCEINSKKIPKANLIRKKIIASLDLIRYEVVRKIFKTLKFIKVVFLLLQIFCHPHIYKL